MSHKRFLVILVAVFTALLLSGIVVSAQGMQYNEAPDTGSQSCRRRTAAR